MILIDATTMWQCETCYWHGNTGCSSFIWCENGESYRPSIDKLKQVDAEPVRHGHWIEIIENGKMKRVTSCCGDDQTKLTVWYKPDYCPNCGAKMDEVSE